MKSCMRACDSVRSPIMALWSMSLVGVFLLSINFRPVASEDILVLLPMASKSHKNVFQPLVEALALRGHSLSFVTPFMPSKPKKNIQEIVVSNHTASLLKSFGNPFDRRSESVITLMTSSREMMVAGCEDAHRSQLFLDLLTKKFDLILLDAFGNDCMAGLIHKLGSPLILVCPMAAPSHITAFTGNRLPTSFVPASILPFQDHMTFLERLTNLAFSCFMTIFMDYYLHPRMEGVYRQHLGQELPSISEVYSNASMLLMNSHFTLTYPRPTLPDVVEVGGMQCGPPKPLPKDLEEFMSGAKDGVIFFSLGSIVQGNQMPEHVRKTFVNVFARLKEHVLWKWETEEMDDLPKNVKLGKWLPQQDILGHKNVKLFITHGGLLSTQEATYHGVPLIGVPIFGDQNLNMKQAERAGYALTIEILEITEEKLETAIKEMLTNPKYADRAKTLSQLFRDQTETPLERAVFWSEYIMRHKGAHHLRSAARQLNFFQYHSIDVIAVLGSILLLVLWIVKVVLFKTIGSVIMYIFGKTGAKKIKSS